MPDREGVRPVKGGPSEAAIEAARLGTLNDHEAQVATTGLHKAHDPALGLDRSVLHVDGPSGGLCHDARAVLRIPLSQDDEEAMEAPFSPLTDAQLKALAARQVAEPGWQPATPAEPAHDCERELKARPDYSPFLGTPTDYRCSCGQRYVYDCDEASGAWWERVDEEGRRDG